MIQTWFFFRSFKTYVDCLKGFIETQCPGEAAAALAIAAYHESWLSNSLQSMLGVQCPPLGYNSGKFRYNSVRPVKTLVNSHTTRISPIKTRVSSETRENRLAFSWKTGHSVSWKTGHPEALTRLVLAKPFASTYKYSKSIRIG